MREDVIKALQNMDEDIDLGAVISNKYLKQLEKDGVITGDRLVDVFWSPHASDLGKNEDGPPRDRQTDWQTERSHPRCSKRTIGGEMNTMACVPLSVT